jgi:hypothetical protein
MLTKAMALHTRFVFMEDTQMYEAWTEENNVSLPQLFYYMYSSDPVSTGKTFQDLPQLCETSDITEVIHNVIFV